MMRPDRFTEKAQEVLAASQELVQNMNHTQWDIEHILLAIMQQNKSLGVEILEIAGVDVSMLRREIQLCLEKAAKSSTTNSTQIFVTPRLQELFQNAETEATRLIEAFNFYSQKNPKEQFGIDHHIRTIRNLKLPI